MSGSGISWPKSSSNKSNSQSSFGGAAATLNRVGEQIRQGANDLYEGCEELAAQGMNAVDKGVRHARNEAMKAVVKGAAKGVWTAVKKSF